MTLCVWLRRQIEDWRWRKEGTYRQQLQAFAQQPGPTMELPAVQPMRARKVAEERARVTSIRR